MKASFTQELAAELDNKEASAPRNNQAESSKRVHKRLYGIIAGLVLMLAISMAGTFASSLVAIESAKDTVISADGAFVDKKTGALISTENPHFTTKAAGQVQALGLLSSEVNVTLRGQKRALYIGARCTSLPTLVLAQAGPHDPHARLESAVRPLTLNASG